MEIEPGIHVLVDGGVVAETNTGGLEVLNVVFQADVEVAVIFVYPTSLLFTLLSPLF